MLLIALLACVPGCKKKGEADILSEETKIADNADINKQIIELKNKVASAKDDFERSEIFGKLSALELEKGDIVSSEKSANDSVKYYPKSAQAYYLLGRAHLSEGRLSEAEAELTTATELDPKHAPSWFELGNLKYTKAAYAPAVEMYKKAVDLDKNHYQAFNNLGSTYYALKMGKESEAAFTKVLSLKSDFAPLYKNMGLLYERLIKDKKKAKASYEEYLKRRPNAPERASVKFWINELGK